MQGTSAALTAAAAAAPQLWLGRRSRRIGRVRATEAKRDRDPGDLARRASEGDTVAAGEFLASSLPYLMGAARKIAPRLGSEAHEDMVQDASLKLLALWAEGEREVENPRGYLVTTMRNAFIDELRSPRSRVDTFDAAGLLTGDLEDGEGSLAAARLVEHPELRVDDAAAHGMVDSAAEREIVREAFGRLRPEAQRVLVATAVEGRRPSELVGEFGRSAPAISSAASRAKRGLRRATLAVLLEEGGPECARHAEALPDRVLADPDEHAAGERGIAHARGCERCRRNWRRFAALSAAFGVVPLFAAVEVIGGARPAAADAGSAQGEQAARAGSATPHERSALQSTPRPRASGAGAPPVLRALSSRWVLALGGALVLAAGALVVIDIVRPAEQSRAAAPVSSAAVTEVDQSGSGESLGGREFDTRFEVSTSREGSQASLLLDFAVLDAAEWEVDSLRLVLPAGAGVNAAGGWDCDGAGAAVTCAPRDARPGPSAFSITLPEGGLEGEARFSLEIAAVASGTGDPSLESETGKAALAAMNHISGRAFGTI